MPPTVGRAARVSTLLSHPLGIIAAVELSFASVAVIGPCAAPRCRRPAERHVVVPAERRAASLCGHHTALSQLGALLVGAAPGATRPSPSWS